MSTRASARIQKGREQARTGIQGLERRRSDSPVIDAGFAMWERDRDIHAGTLAGALAFRLFLFLLPLTLVIVALFGFLISNDPGTSDDLVDRFGLRGALADALLQVSEQGRANRWWALGVGLVGMAWSGMGAVRTLRLVHFIAWGQIPTRIPNVVRAVAAFIGVNVVILGVPLLGQWARAIFGLLGTLSGIIGVFVVYVALWVVLSAALPHRHTPRRYLVPGAVLVALGTYVLHLVTVYVFGPRVEHSASVYGSIAVAAVILTWLYAIARLIVGSAVVNAVLYDRRHGHPPESQMTMPTEEGASSAPAS